MTTEDPQAVSPEWLGLPKKLAAALAAASITPSNVGDWTRDTIARKPGCGHGTVRLIVRAGHIPQDLLTINTDQAAEMLDLPLRLYRELVRRGFELLSDFTGDPAAENPGIDGCILVQYGFTVYQVEQIRRALNKANVNFADLSAKRTLADIPFDKGILAILSECPIDTTVPLQEAGSEWLMKELAVVLGAEEAERYRDRIAHSYWVGGYDLL